MRVGFRPMVNTFMQDVHRFQGMLVELDEQEKEVRGYIETARGFVQIFELCLHKFLGQARAVLDMPLQVDDQLG